MGKHYGKTFAAVASDGQSDVGHCLCHHDEREVMIDMTDDTTTDTLRSEMRLNPG